MKIKHNSLVEYVILGVLGSLVVLTLAVPPLLRDRRCAPVLSLSVLLRDTDNSWTAARQGMELAADELGAELRFLTLTTSNSGEEQEELFLRELEGGADALIVVPSDLEGLYAALLHRENMKKCVLCGGWYIPKSNRAKYCPDCAEQERRRKTRDRVRRHRAGM